MTAQSSNYSLDFRLPEMLSYHSTWDDADYEPNLPRRQPRLRDRFAAVLSPLTRWRDRARVTNELSRMTDRELADIGINRYDVSRISDPQFAREYASRGM